MEERICDLEADLRAMSRLKPVAAVNYIRKVIGYDDYLRSYAEFRRMKPEELFETADKLAESAAEFETFEAWKEHAAKYEEELNLFPVLWTVDPLDWCCNSSQCVYQRVVTTVKENDIILLHDCYETSVTAALSIVDSLQAQGYEFVTVDELLLE